MKGFIPCAAILAAGAAAVAQAPVDPVAAAREQVRRVVVYGAEPCPPSTSGGVSGCWAEMMRMAREERRQAAEGQPQP